MDMTSGDLFDKKGLAEYLKIGRATLQKLMAAKAFPYIKIGRRVLFRKADIDKWLETKIVK
jgi:excisionase family DNA binding protein